MPALDAILQQKLALAEAAGRRRFLHGSARQRAVEVARGGKQLISFSCNDYLGLSAHPEVVAAAVSALQASGAGAGASRLVTGNHPLYGKLEQALADFKGTEAACVFGSGYLANMGVIPALAGAGDLILADKLSHACMLDAARLSGATLMRFAHNNTEHLSLLLEANRRDHQHCLILTETVFSMDGDRAPLAEIASLAARHDAWLMTDDAHGLGIVDSPYGEIRMGTLSKAAGSYGGYVCGSKALIDYLHHAARTLIYSTGLPPAVVAASQAAIRIMKNDPALRRKPLEQAQRFTALLGLEPAQSAIVPLVLGENDKALAASALLEEEGFLVSAIRPPTVPEHTARLRFAFCALHEEVHIEAVAAIIRREGWV